jgi:hypothetical protein
MANTVEEINATYEGLADLEREFEDVETEISAYSLLRIPER